jgi:hypothetical protein
LVPSGLTAHVHAVQAQVETTDVYKEEKKRRKTCQDKFV